MESLTIIKGEKWFFDWDSIQASLITRELFRCLYDTHDQTRANELIQLIEGDISDQLGYEVTVYDDHGYRFLDDGQFAGRFFPVISKKELQQEDAYYDNLPERTDVDQ